MGQESHIRGEGASDAGADLTIWPARLLSTNRELRGHKIASWSIPALFATLSDGRIVKTCPHAGVCASLCYARAGTYNFSNDKARHTRNLELVMNHRLEWRDRMIAEVNRYHRDGWIRIHDAGDFLADWYLELWCEIARACREATFYAYSKEVTMVRAVELPDNLLIVFSLGGKQDHLLDLDNDRHADVFPDIESLEAAGYADQSDDDRLSVLGAQKVGIPANNHRHLLKKQGARSFGELQRFRLELAMRLLDGGEA